MDALLNSEQSSVDDSSLMVNHRGADALHVERRIVKCTVCRVSDVLVLRCWNCRGAFILVGNQMHSRLTLFIHFALAVVMAKMGKAKESCVGEIMDVNATKDVVRS